MATVSDLALLLVAGLAIYLHMQGLPDGGTCKIGDWQLSCQVSAIDCGHLICPGTGGCLTTLVEYSLNGDGNKDFYDVSLVTASTLLSSSILQMASAPPLHAKPT
ncbi:hypothetical protein SUGI_1300970 [Cryptomeria japonica]|uniref:Uncharacterized protein n=1 Tax=Cryptomeria japonica TaxID=3369 RepID=A0AAD3RPZ4_CRYJA|nr:hypothetical protein SUGI_1300890 [Cryptomeria japonica]GLJ57129.1 hypothetical protein SUGI_1300920 [Cryptomeria japonica]GLJ57132.1 hypothetical protein SUGI_1300970 [Cryptomeria japonica]